MNYLVIRVLFNMLRVRVCVRVRVCTAYVSVCLFCRALSVKMVMVATDAEYQK